MRYGNPRSVVEWMHHEHVAVSRTGRQADMQFGLPNERQHSDRRLVLGIRHLSDLQARVDLLHGQPGLHRSKQELHLSGLRELARAGVLWTRLEVFRVFLQASERPVERELHGHSSDLPALPVRDGELEVPADDLLRQSSHRVPILRWSGHSWIR